MGDWVKGPGGLFQGSTGGNEGGVGGGAHASAGHGAASLSGGLATTHVSKAWAALPAAGRADYLGGRKDFVAAAHAIAEGAKSPGHAAVAELLTKGTTDARLSYLRDGMRDMAPFRAALAGRDATSAARTGDFFGKGKPQPIQLDVYHDGKVALGDGRHRYGALREGGATTYMAKITHYGARGGIVREIAGVPVTIR